MSQKGFVLFAVPRSGSTPVGQILGHYTSEEMQIPYVSEVFNLTFAFNGARKMEYEPWPFMPLLTHEIGPLWKSHPHFIEREMERRYQAIIKHPGRYSIKITLPFYDRSKLLNIGRQWSPVILFRRNIWDHYLGFLISYTLDHFYRETPLEADAASIEITDPSWPRLFQQGLLSLIELSRSLPGAKILFYEDFVEGGIDAVLRSLNWESKVDFSKLKLPKKQIQGPKELLIKNIEQVREWYSDLGIHGIALPEI